MSSRGRTWIAAPLVLLASCAIMSTTSTTAVADSQEEAVLPDSESSSSEQLLADGPTTLCGRFPAHQDPIYYKFYSVGSTYQDITYQARNRWNSQLPDVTFRGSASIIDIKIYDAGYSSNVWAFVGPFGDPCSDTTGGFWRNNDVTLNYNTNTMKNLHNWKKSVVAAHELGHAAGLGHPSTSGCNADPSIMHQGDVKFGCSPNPSDNDVIKLNSFYY